MQKALRTAESALQNSDPVIARLIDRHGTGRVLFRNTRQAITGFPARALTTYPLSLPEAYLAYAAELSPEQRAGAGWTAIDPRVDWLLALCRELAPQKLLVIAAYAETVVALREHLLERAGFRVKTLYAEYDKSPYGSTYPGELIFVAEKV